MTLFPWKNELVMVERGSVLLSTYKTNNMEPCKLTFSSIAMIMDTFGLFTHTFEDFKEYNPLKLNAIDYIL